MPEQSPVGSPALRYDVSLLVAMRNEAQHIAECLKSIFAQDLDAARLELLVLDGESTDDSWRIAEDMLKGHDNCRLLSNPKITQSAAWNLGIQQSRGRLLCIVSGHVVLARDFVRNAVHAYERTGADMVGGHVGIIGETGIAKTIAAAMSMRFGSGGAGYRHAIHEEHVDTVFMGLCARSIYELIGGFDEELVKNQDDELSYRIGEQGGRIVFSPSIRSTYHSRSTLAGLWRQYLQYGYWKVRVMQKHPKQMRPRQFVPPLFALALILSLCLAVALRCGWISLAAVAGCYALVNLAASAVSARERGWKHLPLLPFVFAILHVGYGLGFLAGLVRFWNRWGDRKGKVPEFRPREAGD